MVFTRSLYGGDNIVEAKCESCGTNIFYRTYRSDPNYGGVGRWGWTGSVQPLSLLSYYVVGCRTVAEPATPERLLYGEPAQTFAPVPGSVVAAGRVLDASTLGLALRVV